MIPRRVGFVPTFRMSRSASGWMAAATSQNAAPDTSPGTRSSSGRTVDGPATVWIALPSARSSVPTCTPRARSIRSV